MVDFSNYKTPVQIIESTVETFEEEMQKNLDNQIMQAIKKVGVVVDKEGLIRAMSYDRRQYAAGYEDGYKKAVEDYKQSIETLEKAYKEQNYKEHEQILYFAKEIAEQLLGKSELSEKVINIISFLKECFPGEMQIFNCLGMPNDPKKTIYCNGGVTINFCQYYGYVEVLGLSDEEFKIVEKECGKEHEHPVEWVEELNELKRGYNKAIDDFEHELEQSNIGVDKLDCEDIYKIADKLKGVKQNDD